MRTYYLYMLHCSNGAFYTGYTTNFDRRLSEHLKGNATCKYTRSFPPKKIMLCLAINCSLSDILKLEHAVKKLSKTEKMHLINCQKHLDSFLALWEISKFNTVYHKHELAD